ncbi:Zinc phosphodiesterase ELAC protein 2 [Smittium mucronatum]|uniref:ribonuclease Z n=1 Tax=Smittium mucronatum TaxID=133383 RepID=A0A1R0H4B8_9FUNG|nr:Zinc phosphodiesterase ELAC protein 2 [Smittium mucronatum]
MKWFVQVINTPTDSGSVPTLLVHLEKTRYLFNCGEGTQRLFNENTVKISKLKAIFSTQNSWSHIGGLPGLLLTIGSMGVSNLNVYGPKNIAQTLDASRYFTQQAAVSFITKEFGSETPFYSDEFISVYPIFKSPSDSPMILENPVANQIHPPSNVNEIVDKNQETSQMYNSDYNKQSRISTIISYICVGPTVPKKFDMKKASALGLKPGPHFKELVAGRSIVSSTGVEVFPHQVLMDSKPRGAFILVECLNEDSIHSIISNPKFTPFYSNDEASSLDFSGNPSDSDKFSLKFIFHSIGPNVLSNASYLEWMRKFPKSVSHVIGSKEYCGDINPFVQHSNLSLQLRQIDPEIFSFPNSNIIPTKDIADFIKTNGNSLGHIQLASFNLKMDIEPEFRIDSSDSIRYFNYNQMLANWHKKIQSDPIYKSFLNKVPCDQRSLTELASDTKAPKEFSSRNHDFLISTLGTGSAIPSCKRNVSSNLLYIPNYGFALLDTGEGTASQVKRILGTESSPRPNRFGNSTYEDFLDQLKFVYISHNHADHHLGLPQLLEDWHSRNVSHNDNKNILYVVSPVKFQMFIGEISQFLDIGYENISFILSRTFLMPQYDIFSGKVIGQIEEELNPLKKAFYESLGLDSVVTCEVEHYGGCLGVSITHRSGWQLIYSGDTRPTLNMVKLAHYKLNIHKQSLTMLLHEATLYDTLLEDAIKKRHSTVSEAIAISVAMNAENTVFTHFSQRHVGIPSFTLDSVAKTNFNGFGSILHLLESGIYENHGSSTNGSEFRSSQPAIELVNCDCDLIEDSYIAGRRILADRLQNLSLAYAFDMAVFSVEDVQRYGSLIDKMKLLFFDEEEEQIEEIQTNKNEKKRRRG